VMKSPFLQWYNLQGGSSNPNQQGGISCAPQTYGYQRVVSMLSHKKIETIELSTRNCYYNNPKSTEKGKRLQKIRHLYT
jgi:hypothetical protein